MTNKELIQAWFNKEKREAFLKAYKDWGIQLVVQKYGLTFYSYVLPDNTEILSVEFPYLKFMGYGKSSEWDTNNWFYVLKPGERFSLSNHSSFWQVADVLKDAKTALQKQEKAGAPA